MSVVRLKQCAEPGCTHEFPKHYWSDYCADHDKGSRSLSKPKPDGKTKKAK